MVKRVTIELPDGMYEDLRHICFSCDGLRPLPLGVTLMTALATGIGTIKAGIVGGIGHATLDTGGFVVEIQTKRVDKPNLFG